MTDFTGGDARSALGRHDLAADRTYHSMLIDALTVGVAILGLQALQDRFSLADFSEPVQRLWISVRSTLPLGSLFAVLFRFLFKDWSLAREIDHLSPERPRATGARFYLDVIVLWLFWGAFEYARRGDTRVCSLIGLIYAVGGIWSMVIALWAENLEAVVRARRYVVSHALACWLFMALYFHFLRSPATRTQLDEGALWGLFALYVVVEAMEGTLRLLVHWGWRHLRPRPEFWGR